MAIAVSLDAGKALAKLKAPARKHPEALKRGLMRFVAHMQRVTNTTFERLAHGGKYRGVTWEPFKDQYTRKTDGVTVPAEGGVAKVRGKGQVKGRLRPSGQRVSSRSKLLQDRGSLKKAALMGWRVEPQKRRAILRITGPAQKYWKRQQLMRPFLFFGMPGDMNAFRRIMREEIGRAMQ